MQNTSRNLRLIFYCPPEGSEILKMPLFCLFFQSQKSNNYIFLFFFVFLKKGPQIYTDKNHCEDFLGEGNKFSVVRIGNHAEILTPMIFFFQNTQIAFFFKKKKKESCVKYNSK